MRTGFRGFKPEIAIFEFEKGVYRESKVYRYNGTFAFIRGWRKGQNKRKWYILHKPTGKLAEVHIEGCKEIVLSAYSLVDIRRALEIVLDESTDVFDYLSQFKPIMDKYKYRFKEISGYD